MYAYIHIYRQQIRTVKKQSGCTWTHTYTYTHIYGYIHIYIHIYTYIHVCIYIYTDSRSEP